MPSAPIRFWRIVGAPHLFDYEETPLRKAIEVTCPEHMAEFELALNTGLRLSEQYGLLWENVSVPLRTLTISRSKKRHYAARLAE